MQTPYLRDRRDDALRSFDLVDEMPYNRNEHELEEITQNLERPAVNRVDTGIYKVRRRRFNAKRKLEEKEIDEVVIKALLRLANAVGDCFTYEHQAINAHQVAISRKVARAVRESKAKDIFKSKVYDEMRIRTRLRQEKIDREKVERENIRAKKRMIEREEDLRASKKSHNKKVLELAEYDFARIAAIEQEQIREQQKIKRLQKAQSVKADRQMKQEKLLNDLRRLRTGMDYLDSAADAMINRRNFK